MVVVIWGRARRICQGYSVGESRMKNIFELSKSEAQRVEMMDIEEAKEGEN